MDPEIISTVTEYRLPDRRTIASVSFVEEDGDYPAVYYLTIKRSRRHHPVEFVTSNQDEVMRIMTEELNKRP